MPSFPTLKLTYFDMEGRAEPIRVALFAASIPFIDERLSREDFQPRKLTFPYGVAPVLEVNGQVLGETQAIARYVGRLTNTYPVNDPLGAVLVDEILSAIEEFGSKYLPLLHESDSVKKQQLIDNLIQVTIPRYLTLIDARVEAIRHHPTLPEDPMKLYVHELWVHSFSSVMLNPGFMTFLPPNLIEGYKNWMRIDAKYAAHPKVQQWHALQHQRPKKLKLIYLNAAKRDVPIRLALYLGDVPFESQVLARDEFLQIKSSLPYQQLPVLEIDGKVVAQSMALVRYAGTLAGLYPENDLLQSFKIDELCGPLDEMYNTWAPSFAEQDPEKQRRMRETIASEVIPKYLGGLNKRVESWAAPYATGQHMSVADLLFYALVEFLRSGVMSHIPPKIVEEYSQLVAIHDLVAKHPKVQKWVRDETS